LALALVAPVVFALVGCTAFPGLGDTPSDRTETSSGEASAGPEAQNHSTESGEHALRTQGESCDWDTPALRSDGSSAPHGSEGELHTTIVGAWQHTHFDSGGGYEAVTADIRYVFPSSGRLLYCQHVEGVTDHRENATDISWDDTRIVLPVAAPGWVVIAWDADTMVWLNRADDSHYLLQRR
ncbi:MAG TPA: hypothetical protein VFN04_00215, partial [Protaetiibacter sp.]|nr:hypothetical protein [Protaetiibacter sp.]